MSREQLIAAGYTEVADGSWLKLRPDKPINAGSNTGTSSFPPVNRSSDPASQSPPALAGLPAGDSTPLRGAGGTKANENHRVSPSPKLEQTVCDASMGQAPRKESDPTCRKISIVSYRKRLIDPDNLCPKYFIDALRYCGVLADDSAKHITLEVRQEKSDNPRTEITIE